MARVVFVGILNITPDSFSDGDKYVSSQAALQHAEQLLQDGAELIDIGAESTNPRSTPLTATEEIARLEPILPTIASTIGDQVISLDTYHPETVQWALDHGIHPIINDVSGLANPAMKQLIIDHKLTVIISHLPTSADGVPARAHTQDLIDNIEIVRDELLKTAQALEVAGVPTSHIILDPGIGFGKTMRLNWQLLEFAAQVPGYNIMLGYSRKRFLHTDRSTGREIPELISLKEQGGPAYETWLATQHKTIAHSIEVSNLSSDQTVFLRVHELV